MENNPVVAVVAFALNLATLGAIFTSAYQSKKNGEKIIELQNQQTSMKAELLEIRNSTLALQANVGKIIAALPKAE